jgi:hypothetical protein
MRVAVFSMALLPSGTPPEVAAPPPAARAARPGNLRVDLAAGFLKVDPAVPMPLATVLKAQHAA